MEKNYTSFQEIDLELRRLKLQSQISREELKLSFHEVKDSITPSKLFGTVLGGLASSAVIIKLLTPIASYGIGKMMAKREERKADNKHWWSSLLS